MASNLLKVPIFSKLPSLAPRIIVPSATYHKERIGNREIVGFGLNGEPSYIDRTDFPMPAIRFKENSQEITALREKEKGDWKTLSMDEKKMLYRASFRQTFSEIKAPTGEWKSIIAGTLVAMSLTVWLYIWMKKYVYQPMPDSFTPERKAAQLKRIIDLRMNPIEGIASKYDYENNRWKD